MNMPDERINRDDLTPIGQTAYDELIGTWPPEEITLQMISEMIHLFETDQM